MIPYSKCIFVYDGSMCECVFMIMLKKISFIYIFVEYYKNLVIYSTTFSILQLKRIIKIEYSNIKVLTFEYNISNAIKYYIVFL